MANASIAQSSGAADSSWGILGSFLDTRSLIAETIDGADGVLSAKARSIVDKAIHAATAAVEIASLEDRTKFRAGAVAFLEMIDQQSPDGGWSAFSPDFNAAAKHDNFYLGLLAVNFSYMRRCAPVAWCASRLLLSEIAGLNFDPLNLWIDRIAADLGWSYAERDLDAHLTLVAHCIVQSVLNSASRFVAPQLANFASTA